MVTDPKLNVVMQVQYCEIDYNAEPGWWLLNVHPNATGWQENIQRHTRYSGSVTPIRSRRCQGSYNVAIYSCNLIACSCRGLVVLLVHYTHPLPSGIT
jgi:hypothetical protein